MPSVNDLTTAMGSVAASALTILIVSVIAYVILKIARRFVIPFVIERLEPSDDDTDTREATIAETQKRVETVSSLAEWLLRIVIVTFAVVAVLVELGQQGLVLVLAAIVAGVALIAQDVLRDYVGGAIIVLENQFGIGDWVMIAGAAGEVETISLRRTTLDASSMPPARRSPPIRSSVISSLRRRGCFASTGSMPPGSGCSSVAGSARPSGSGSTGSSASASSWR